MNAAPHILLIGYGNPGRLDDGLGPALAERVRRMELPGVHVDCDYQLTVEDAHAVSQYETAVFADADVSRPAPFSFRRVEPQRVSQYTSRWVEPEQVAAWMAVSLVRGETAPYRGAASGEALCDYRTGTSLRVAVWTEVVQSMAAGETGAFRCEDWLGRGQTVYVELG